MTGETVDRHPGEHPWPGSPQGWYADPVRRSTLRRWDGAHWTADIEPWPTPPATARTTTGTGHRVRMILGAVFLGLLLLPVVIWLGAWVVLIFDL